MEGTPPGEDSWAGRSRRGKRMRRRRQERERDREATTKCRLFPGLWPVAAQLPLNLPSSPPPPCPPDGGAGAGAGTSIVLADEVESDGDSNHDEHCEDAEQPSFPHLPPLLFPRQWHPGRHWQLP